MSTIIVALASTELWAFFYARKKKVGTIFLIAQITDLIKSSSAKFRNYLNIITMHSKKKEELNRLVKLFPRISELKLLFHVFWIFFGGWMLKC